MNSRYRVLHLIKGFGRGGAETLLSEGIAFANQDLFSYEYAYFLPRKDALVSSLQVRGAEVVCLHASNSWKIAAAIPRLIDILKNKKIDLVHCHLPVSAAAGRIAAKFSGLPVIYTEHNVMERYHPWTRRINLWTWKYQKLVIAVSEEVKTSITKYAGDAVKVVVVPNGIPVNSFAVSPEERRRVRSELRIPLDSPVVGTVAVLRKQKDLFTWIDAARLLVKLHPDAHFLIVGDGPLKSEILSYTRQAGLADVVHFAGLQGDVRPYYSAMDVYMNSSVFEGLPLTLLEAMAMQLPVVATTVGGMPEAVEDGETGFLVPRQNAQALAEKASLLLNSKQERLAFGCSGRKVVTDRFGMQRMIREQENLYLEILEDRELVR